MTIAFISFFLFFQMDNFEITVEKCQVLHTWKAANDAHLVMVSSTGQEMVCVMGKNSLKMSAQILLTGK